MKALLRFFFRLLYHQFAWTYDLVAATVSFNRWKTWVLSVIPFIEGRRILELGHGPGHLQRALQEGNTQDEARLVAGIDESAQMGRQAKHNLSRLPHPVAYTQTNLTRGLAQQLPFPDESFDTIVATFPTEYFMDAKTLAEVKRCLGPGGRFVVLPVALPKNQLLDGLFKATHQRPTEALEVIRSRLEKPFASAGFRAEVKQLDAPSGILMVVIARKPAP